jgi:hypothetical protein
MLKCVEGVYRNGEVELLESPPNVTEARVIVAFLEQSPSGPPLTREELAELRGKLAAWEEDWNAPGMEAYDAM